MKKIVYISDSFKGTLSSPAICRIAEETIPRFFPGCRVITLPVADGGEGTVDCFVRVLKARPVHVTVQGALDPAVDAVYAVMGTTAVIEMAAAAGLPSVYGREDPLKATTYGVGQIIRHAVENGCREILLGLGGSATNDGGCGCAAALGVVFTDEAGQAFVPAGGTLKDIAHVDISGAQALLKDVHITIMSDVENPMYGTTGAAYIFGPQKGASPEQVVFLDAGLRHLSEVIIRDLDRDVSAIHGAGAAGAMGAGCAAFLGADIRSGIDAILDITGFDEKVQGADLVFTGEGRIDSQSVHGKVISGVAARTAPAGIPLIVIAGSADDSAREAYDAGVTAIFTTDRKALPFPELAGRAEQDYRAALEDVLRLIRCLRPGE